MNEYINDKINIYHFDIYRLNNSDDFFDIGGNEYFEKGICIIEWGKIIEDILPQNTIFVDFEKDINNDNIRIITINIPNKH